jgi:hypothetical protein
MTGRVPYCVGYDLTLAGSVMCSSVSRELSLHTSCYVSFRVEYVIRGMV